MKIGIVKEIKTGETRVSLTPHSVKVLTCKGHSVFFQTEAGKESGFLDEQYKEAGAKLLNSIEEVYAQSDMIVKVKEPQPCEYDLLKQGQILFSFLHLAVEPELLKVLLKKKICAIACESVQKKDGKLPILQPMSEVAGKMSVQIGAHFLEKNNGGRGVLLGGIAGVNPAKVVIVGGGIVGCNAARVAHGMGADVTILDICLERLRELDSMFNHHVKTLFSNTPAVEAAVKDADLLIGAVLIPNKKAPCLISEKVVKTMKKGAVIVDVAIDQGGIVETMDRVTTHENPVFEKHGVMHYSVANIPGAVGRTSSIGFSNAILPYVEILADKGLVNAIKTTPSLEKGVNTYDSNITCEALAQSLGAQHTELPLLIGF